MTLSKLHSGSVGTMLWVMLAMRLVLFAVFQGLIALAVIGSVEHPWDVSTKWWPFGIVATNLITVVLLNRLFALEGKSYFALFRFDRARFKSDMLPVLGISVLVVAAAMIPNVLLANLLLGGSDVAASFFIHKLPFWAAAFLLLAFPITIAMSEFPLYFAYILPRLENRVGVVLAMTLTVFFVCAQHATMPLVFNWAFIIWRLVMFVPFAILLGFVFRWRPRLLPYFVVLHGLLDMSLIAAMF